MAELFLVLAGFLQVHLPFDRYISGPALARVCRHLEISDVSYRSYLCYFHEAITLPRMSEVEIYGDLGRLHPVMRWSMFEASRYVDRIGEQIRFNTQVLCRPEDNPALCRLKEHALFIYKVYDFMDDLTDPNAGLMRKRRAIRHLKTMLGEVDFFSGNLPPVLVWIPDNGR